MRLKTVLRSCGCGHHSLFLFFLSSQVCYAKELKEGFVEYTEQVVKLMVPLLKFYFHDDILLL